MKKHFEAIVLTMLTAVELLLLTWFAVQDADWRQDAVAINDAVHSVQAEWDALEGYQDRTGLDYVVLDSSGEVLYRTESGLSESVHEAVLHRDTVLDVEKNDVVAGKVIFYNDQADRFRKEKRRAVFLLGGVILLQWAAGVGYALYLKHVVIKPFRKLKDFARRVAGGNLDVPLEMDRQNLFGAFTESFDLMRAELKKARIAEAAANASKKELVAELSHDIKTPVASIKAAAEVGAALAESMWLKESIYMKAGMCLKESIYSEENMCLEEDMYSEADMCLEEDMCPGENICPEEGKECCSVGEIREYGTAWKEDENKIYKNIDCCNCDSKKQFKVGNAEAGIGTWGGDSSRGSSGGGSSSRGDNSRDSSPRGGKDAVSGVIRENYQQIIRKADQINTLVTNLFTATLEELEQLTVAPGDMESRELKYILENADYLHRASVPQIPSCLLYADRLRLQQVFDNLFANSYKYADTGIELRIQEADGYLWVSLEDYGGGVSEEELPLLKEKFKRGSNAKEIEGAGLGLYLAGYFMEKMQGRLLVENGEKGLKVTVLILLSGRGI